MYFNLYFTFWNKFRGIKIKILLPIRHIFRLVEPLEKYTLKIKIKLSKVEESFGKEKKLDLLNFFFEFLNTS